MKFRAKLTDRMLGTNPGNDGMFEDWIKGKRDEMAEMAADEDCLGTVGEEVAKDTTIFRRDDEGYLCIPGYMIKGNLKSNGDTIRSRRAVGKTKDDKGKTPKSGWESWRSKVDNNVHIRPKLIRILKPSENGTLEPIKTIDGVVVRPLRAKTMQGERVSLARSEYVAEGSVIEFEIINRGAGVVTDKQIIECLEEGEFYGLGQWRNAGNGTFTVEML